MFTITKLFNFFIPYLFGILGRIYACVLNKNILNNVYDFNFLVHY